jgi:4-hydroxybenzoate polyprenyltransferase
MTGLLRHVTGRPAGCEVSREGPFQDVAIPMHKRHGRSRLVLEFLYPSRLLFYLWLLCFGFLHTARQAGILPRILNPAELLKLLCAVCSITLLFVYAKIINDIHDLDIDRISNSRRPLVEGIICEDEAHGLATVMMTLSGVLAIPVERDFFYLWFFIWGLSYLYSTPPFRLRRFWPIGHVSLALVGIGTFMAGACIARPDAFYTVWRKMEILACLFFAFFFLCQIKDLKDIEGDRVGGAGNLFGRVSHPRALALIFYGGFLGAAFLLTTSIGVDIAATIAGTLVCAVVAIIMTLRTRQLAGLDRLFALSFIFIMYLSGAWLYLALKSG